MAAGVVFLPSFYEAIKDLQDSERLQMYDAIVRFGLYGEVIDLSPVSKSLFTLVKPVIESSQNRYRAAKANGLKGGRPPKNQKENQTDDQTENQRQNQDKDIDKDKDSDSDKDSEREKDCQGKGETTNNRFLQLLERKGLTKEE